MGGIVAIAIVAGVVTLGIVVARGGLSGARYVITVRGDGISGVVIKGTVPGYDVGEVAAFIADLDLPVGARLWGIPDGDRITLRFSSSVPDHLHQRLRNFLYLRH